MTKHEQAAYRYGRAIMTIFPPRMAGLSIATRPLGLNPFDLWTPPYYAFNRGYEERAGELLGAADPFPIRSRIP